MIPIYGLILILSFSNFFPIINNFIRKKREERRRNHKIQQGSPKASLRNIQHYIGINNISQTHPPICNFICQSILEPRNMSKRDIQGSNQIPNLMNQVPIIS